MNRYDIALGKKPPEKPLDEAMRKALDEPTTSLGYMVPIPESMIAPIKNIIGHSSLSNYSYKKRIPATGDWS
jgi:hypothetical protein